MLRKVIRQVKRVGLRTWESQAKVGWIPRQCTVVEEHTSWLAWQCSCVILVVPFWAVVSDFRSDRYMPAAMPPLATTRLAAEFSIRRLPDYFASAIDCFRSLGHGHWNRPIDCQSIRSLGLLNRSIEGPFFRASSIDDRIDWQSIGLVPIELRTLRVAGCWVVVWVVVLVVGH